MMQWPHQFWPAGLYPSGRWVDDASRYEVVRESDGVAVAVVPPEVTETVISGASGGDERYYVRAYNRINLPDRDPITGDLRRVAFDDDGNLILPVPSPTQALRLVAGAGGLVMAQWTHSARLGTPSAKTFNVYVGTGATPISFAAPTLPGVTSGGRVREASLGAFAHGTVVRAVVRAVSALGAEERNTVEASVVADALAPNAVASITLEVAFG